MEYGKQTLISKGLFKDKNDNTWRYNHTQTKYNK